MVKVSDGVVTDLGWGEIRMQCRFWIARTVDVAG